MYIHDTNSNDLYIVYNKNFVLSIDSRCHIDNIIYKDIRIMIDYEDPKLEERGYEIWDTKRTMNWFGDIGLKELFKDIFTKSDAKSYIDKYYKNVT